VGKKKKIRQRKSLRKARSLRAQRRREKGERERSGREGEAIRPASQKNLLWDASRSIGGERGEGGPQRAKQGLK